MSELDKGCCALMDQQSALVISRLEFKLKLPKARMRPHRWPRPHVTCGEEMTAADIACLHTIMQGTSDAIEGRKSG